MSKQLTQKKQRAYDYHESMDKLIEILGSKSASNVWKLMTDGQKIKLHELVSPGVAHLEAVRREAEIHGLSLAHYCVEDGSPEERRINNAIEALEIESHLHPLQEDTKSE